MWWCIDPRRGAFAAALFLCAPLPLAAQRYPVQPIELLGRDVRVVAERTDTGEIRGKVIAADRSLLTIQPEGADTLRIPLETIQRLRVRASSGTQMADGLLGLIVGAVAGAVIEGYYVHHHGDAEGTLAYAIVIGAPAGALLGGATGLAIGYDHFEDVPLR